MTDTAEHQQTIKLITVKSDYSRSDLRAAINILTETGKSAIKMAGCLQYEVYGNAGETGRVFIIQKWQSEAGFEAYRTSKLFAEMADAVKPLMTSPPETLIYDATAHG